MATPTAKVTMKRIKIDNSALKMPEEDVKNLIVSTHARSEAHVDVKSVFNATDSILTRATSIVESIVTGNQSHKESVESKALQASVNAPAGIIENINREMGCKALHGEHQLKATISLFSMLSNYSWDAKAVLTLAAFAVNYGEFWLLTQHPSDQLAKSVAFLKGIPMTLNPSSPQRLGIDLLNNLVKAVLEITRGIIQIEKHSMKFNVKDVPALKTALESVPVYVYWIITTVVCCSSHLSCLMEDENSVQEISNFSHILTNVYAKLLKQIDDVNQQKDEYNAFHMLLKLSAHPTDNVEILRQLIYIKDDAQPLVCGSTKQMVNLDDLRKKHVLLHISGLNMSLDELNTLKQTYNDSKKKDSQYEIVWIPIVEEWNEVAQQKFQTVISQIPWYTVQRPSLLYDTPAGRAAIKFIKHEWHFQNKTIVVSMDPQGKVQHPNCLHMLRIWGSKAFPFSATVEKDRWRKSTWSTELLLDGIHSTFQDWIKEGKYIFIYGGNDLEDFEEKAKFIAAEARLPLELVNVSRIRGRKDNSIFEAFWKRFESLSISKMHSYSHGEQDTIMHEMEMIKNNNKVGSWAVLTKGSKVLANYHGSIVLSALRQFDLWKKNVNSKGFDAALKEYIGADEGHKCRHFSFPTKAGKIPDHMKCPDCPRNMEKFIAFQCCHNDEDVTTIC